MEQPKRRDLSYAMITGEIDMPSLNRSPFKSKPPSPRRIKIQPLKTVNPCKPLSASFLQCISQPTPLQKVVQEIRLDAQQKGLTPEILEEILKDD
jgi:hypothetical protein